MNKQKVPKLRFPEFTGEWEEKKLGEVSSIVMGQSPESKSYNQNNIGVPLIQGNADIYQRVSNPRNYTSEPTKKYCNSGDILMTVRAPVGSIAKSVHHACIGRGVCSIKAENDFIYYYLLKYEPKWISFSQGSTFTAVNSADIKNLCVNIPKILNEQEKIADFLTLFDKEIELEEKKLELLKENKKGYMQKIFSQEIRFKDDNGNDYPQWEEKKVDECLYSLSSKLYQIKKEDYLITGLFKVIDQSKNYIAGYCNDKTKLFTNIPVIIYGDHTTIIKYIDFDFVIGADGTKTLKTKSNNLKYLYYNLCFNNIEPEGYKRHFSILKKIKLQLPSLPEQEKIANFLSMADKEIELMENKIEKLKEIKKGLLQQMFI